MVTAGLNEVISLLLTANLIPPYCGGAVNTVSSGLEIRLQTSISIDQVAKTENEDIESSVCLPILSNR